MTEFLHDVVRKQNLDSYMRANPNNDWVNFVDPWSNIDITQLGRDWLAVNARNQPEQNIHYSGGPH